MFAAKPFFPLVCVLLLAAVCPAQQKTPQQQAPAIPGQKNAGAANGSSTSTPAGSPAQQGGESKSAAPSAARDTASGKDSKLSPLDPAPAPARTKSRPRIGLALGGGGALALSEIGTLEWFEEHHIPVDVIAGTSMGCMISGLYSTGLTPQELKSVMDSKVFASVFSFTNSYQSRSFRRREESRELPNGITIGLKHGVSFRNSVLTDQGLNAFLDRHFLRYDDQTDFNALPIPLRCVSTDLNEARPVTFARGSIPNAVRASVSLPGVYQPFEMNGHEYVDGGVLDNLPTSSVKDMQADVILAVSLPLQPVGKGDLNSLLGVLGRSFSVAIEGAERDQRKLANVVIMPDISGFGAADYLKTIDLAKRGYAAAEQHHDQLMQYSLNDADWSAYLVDRASRRRGPAGPVLRVRVSAPSDSATIAIQRIFAPLVNQPVDTAKIEALLDQVRSDGRYQADYTVGYETMQQFRQQQAGTKAVPTDAVDVAVATRTDQIPPDQIPTKPKGPQQHGPGAAIAKPGSTTNQPGVKGDDSAPSDNPNAKGLAATQKVTAQSLANIEARPILLITVQEKKTGPPFLVLGANVQAQAAGITHAYVEGILLDQDFGGYGAELRTTFKLGYLTQLDTEYFRPLGLFSSPQHTLFVAPHAGLLRQPYAIYNNQNHIADRQMQRFDIGADLGWTNQRTQELRAGLDFAHVSWEPIIGADTQANIHGTTQRARVLYNFDTQDRALVPQFGLHVRSEFAYLYATVASPDTPQITTAVSYSHRFRAFENPADSIDPNTKQPRINKGRNVFVLSGEFGTGFHRNIAEPSRYTLGGPLRLGASAIDQYRGTDYYLLQPALLRRIAQLPNPIGQNFYLGLGLEGGQMFSPTGATISRADAYFGFVAETPLGVVTLAPAVGTNGERKFIFTIGKLF